MRRENTDACLPLRPTVRALQLTSPVPSYLHTYYWWAYVHPQAVRVFERQWLANVILWGNYGRLRDAALAELDRDLTGRTLQVACAYGDLTRRLCERLPTSGATLDVIDVLPIQIENLRRKLPAGAPVRLRAMDSSSLDMADASYDRVLLFFLLHEQPEDIRRRTLSEAYRVVKPGGRIVIVDYGLPHRRNPLRYLFRPVLATLEPFALDLWRNEVSTWLPARAQRNLRKETYFGGLYQKIVVEKS
jgi:ubiquinone/menaquinone biosynthesis C-methylase UbiE